LIGKAKQQIPGGMTERKARTGARFAREKQVLRCAQNDNSKQQEQEQEQQQKQEQEQEPMQGSLHYALRASVEMTGFEWFGSEAVR
jgi:hypothetical protein